MVCYFVMFGISSFMDGNTLDLLVLTGIVLGLVVEILVNPLFRFMERDNREYDPYMMFPFPFKAYWTFFTNILYYIVVALVMYFAFYLGLNELINYIKGTEGAIAVGVEPLLFGTFTVLADMIFIGIKDLIVYLVKKFSKEKAANV